MTLEASPLLEGDERSSWADNPILHVTRLCLSFCQGLFEQSPMEDLRWFPDPEQTRILITDDAPIDSEVINKRPAIVPVRSAMSFAGIAMDQLQSMRPDTTERVHTDLIPGHMTFNCIARKKWRAELIGWVVARHCWILRRLFLKAGFHDFGQRIGMQPPSPPGALISGAAEAESVNVAIVVPFYFQWGDTINSQDNRTLSAIEARITTNCPRILTPTAVPFGGTPGPGLSGSSIGAKTTGTEKQFVQPPWQKRRAREVVIRRMEDTCNPLSVTVKT